MSEQHAQADGRVLLGSELGLSLGGLREEVLRKTGSKAGSTELGR
jgi:hypothetical protein